MLDVACWWYKRFRSATIVNAIVWLAWTVAILLPVPPFSSLQPIIVGGGAGTWFLVGYFLFAIVAVGGFAGVSSLVFVIEAHELRRLDYGAMLIGFILLYGGTLAGCLLLGLAGASGGYAAVMQQSTVNGIQNILSPYAEPITAASSVAVAGTAFTIYAMATAKATTYVGPIPNTSTANSLQKAVSTRAHTSRRLVLPRSL